MKVAGKILNFYGWYGVVGCVVLRIFGVAFTVTNPAQFATCVLYSVAFKYGANSISKQTMLTHIDFIADHMEKVTNKLYKEYLATSELVSNSFIDKDPVKLQQAVSSLLEGKNKMIETEIQPPDEAELEQLQMIDIEPQGEGDDEEGWVNVSKD